MDEQSHLEVNFFRPKSEATKANTKLITLLVVIWAVAVFGFQFLLIGIGKPTEEKTPEGSSCQRGMRAQRVIILHLFLFCIQRSRRVPASLPR